MKAIRITDVGGPDVLKIQDVPVPEPGPGQARVRLSATGINFVDVYQRRGGYPMPLPFTPGLEGAGVVDALGPGVDTVKIGDRVAYTGQIGSYAEANVVDAGSLIPLPERFSFEDGAAFPLQGMTAHYLIHEFHTIVPGDVVLVHAAAGGMGLLLVQWAKHIGARVIGTVSTDDKARLAKGAGADDVILYTQQDFVAETKRLTGDHGADLIIDGVGKTTFPGDLEAAALRGTIVVFGGASGPADPVAPNALMGRSLKIGGGMLGNYTLTRGELLRRSGDVIRGIEEGWLKLTINHEYPLAEASEAHRAIEGRHSTGKILLKTA
jgi:NADPH2:quinone reductase